MGHTHQTMFLDPPHPQTHPKPSVTPVMSCDVINMMRLWPLTFLDPYCVVPHPTSFITYTRIFSEPLLLPTFGRWQPLLGLFHLFIHGYLPAHNSPKCTAEQILELPEAARRVYHSMLYNHSQYLFSFISQYKLKSATKYCNEMYLTLHFNVTQ